MKNFEKTKLKFFEYSHLPEHLQVLSEPYYHLACALVKASRNLDPSDLAAFEQLDLAFQKLIEAKDCTVRAGLR